MFYTREMNRKIEEYRAMIEQKNREYPSNKDRWDLILKKQISYFRRQCAVQIALFKEKDVDNSGEISWEEFLNYESVKRSRS